MELSRHFPLRTQQLQAHSKCGPHLLPPAMASQSERVFKFHPYITLPSCLVFGKFLILSESQLHVYEMDMTNATSESFGHH